VCIVCAGSNGSKSKSREREREFTKNNNNEDEENEDEKGKRVKERADMLKRRERDISSQMTLGNSPFRP
jgi:hypothetical protein